jgi:predicted nucleic acid-binding Zn ribbon protein
MHESGPNDCPQCKGGLKKVISAPSLVSRDFSSKTAAKY